MADSISNAATNPGCYLANQAQGSQTSHTRNELPCGITSNISGSSVVLQHSEYTPSTLSDHHATYRSQTTSQHAPPLSVTSGILLNSRLPMPSTHANGVVSDSHPRYLPNLPLDQPTYAFNDQNFRGHHEVMGAYTTAQYHSPTYQMSQACSNLLDTSVPFNELEHHPEGTLIDANGSHVPFKLQAAIPKKFFKSDGHYTCYRRNYFSVSAGLSFKKPIAWNQFRIKLANGDRHQTIGFAVSLSATTAGENGETRQLVQHTPKRTKHSESVPQRGIVTPTVDYLGYNQTINVGCQTSGIYKNSQFDAYASHDVSMTPQSANNGPPTVYNFDRLQFQKATANNGKRRAQQQLFQVIVSIEVCYRDRNGNETWTAIASRKSEPMVVRGRSPGHYKDNYSDLDGDDGSSRHQKANRQFNPLPPINHRTDMLAPWAAHYSYPPHTSYCGGASRIQRPEDGLSTSLSPTGSNQSSIQSMTESHMGSQPVPLSTGPSEDRSIYQPLSIGHVLNHPATQDKGFNQRQYYEDTGINRFLGHSEYDFNMALPDMGL